MTKISKNGPHKIETLGKNWNLARKQKSLTTAAIHVEPTSC